MTTIALTGGGTAGHIMPSLALLPLLYKHYDRVIFVGSTKALDQKIVESYGVPFYPIDCLPFSRTHLLQNAKIPFELSRGIKAVKDIFLGEKPSVLFVKGGYASLPSAYAAKSLNIPIVVHESDFSMGLANKLVSTFASTVLTSFPETSGGTYVGTPVRDEVYTVDKEKARTKYGLKNMTTITFCGGSLGAEAINQAVRDALPILTKDYQVIHVSGNGYRGTTRANYLELPYAEDLLALFALSDVVVTRGGANTLAELATLGKRTICIPLPKGNSRGDQVENALSYKKRGYLTVLDQKSLTVASLTSAIATALKLPAPTPLQSKEVNHKIVEYILKAR